MSHEISNLLFGNFRLLINRSRRSTAPLAHRADSDSSA
jgi:hypothetical protein